jgi:hypothetical protein
MPGITCCLLNGTGGSRTWDGFCPDGLAPLREAELWNGFCPDGLAPLPARRALPRRGYMTQPRVSTLGTDHPERRALKGRQIKSTNKAEVGLMVTPLGCAL